VEPTGTSMCRKLNQNQRLTMLLGLSQNSLERCSGAGDGNRTSRTVTLQDIDFKKALSG
jgi:hypothetical protein